MNNKTKIILGIVAVTALAILGYTYLKAPTDNTISKASSSFKEVTSADFAVGSSTSTVTIVEYADFQCPACAAYHPLVETLKAEYKDKVRFVFRVFPLPMHLNAVSSGIAAEAAGAQGKYFEMADKLFTNQQSWETSTTPNDIFVTYATEIGLDVEKFKADIASESLKQKIVTSYKEGVQAKVSSTPTFFINGVKIKNPSGTTNEEVLKGFRALVDAELVKAGVPSEVLSTSTVSASN